VNPRQRVLTSFHHKTPDRVPLDYCAVPELDALLMRTLGVADRELLLQRLRVDFRHLDKWGTMLPRYVGPEPAEADEGVIEDMWGCRRKKVEYRPGCFYWEWVDYPLADATTVKDIERHRWPDPDWYDFSPVAEYCGRDNPYCLVAGLGATLDSVGFFRGMDQAMLDLYDNPAIVEAIVEKLFEFKYEYNVRLLAATGGRLDVLFVSEDMAGQESLIVSRDMLRRYVFPKLEQYAELAHKHQAMAMLHSDGAIRDVIPDLIDIGIDIIDPVQTTCRGMDPAGLKRDFGDRLCFHGVLDTQGFAQRGRPEQVLDGAKRLVDVMGANGGLALGPNNAFQIDVPVPNVLTVYDGMSAGKE
jgi:uroporphyrinogen decarboxylase